MPPEQNNDGEAATRGVESQNGEGGQESERGLGVSFAGHKQMIHVLKRKVRIWQ